MRGFAGTVGTASARTCPAAAHSRGRTAGRPAPWGVQGRPLRLRRDVGAARASASDDLADLASPARPENLPGTRKSFSEAELAEEVEQEVRADLDSAQKAMDNDEVLYLYVLRCNDAGLVVRFSNLLEGFVPVKQLSGYTKNLYRQNIEAYKSKSKVEKPLTGQTLPLCVIDVKPRAPEGNQVSFRHAVILSQTRAQDLEVDKFFERTNVGDLVECYVKNITHFGIFVRLGPVDALIHKSRVWMPDMDEDLLKGGRLKGGAAGKAEFEAKLNASFALGDRVKAVVTKLDPQKKEVDLSMVDMVENRKKLSLSELAQAMEDAVVESSVCQIPEFMQLCSALDKMVEITEIVPGPCLKSGAVAPEFQVLLSSKEVEGGFEVFARKGFDVQEAKIKTELDKKKLRVLLQRVSSEFV